MSVIRSGESDSFSQQIVVFKKGDLTKAPLIETTSQSTGYREIGFSYKLSDFSSDKEFYNHDSNEFIRREYREYGDIKNLGKNIFPAVHGYAIKDSDSVFGIVNNYPTGCGYLSDAQDEVECFLMRNTRLDDDKGLPDVLQDSQKVTFSYFLMLDKVEEYSKDSMILNDYFNLPVTTEYSDEDRNRMLENTPIEDETDIDFYELLMQSYNLLLEWTTSPSEPQVTEDVPNPLESTSIEVAKQAQGSFSLLKNKNLDKNVEVFDLFQTHNNEYFIRVRNREEPTFLGENLRSSSQEVDIDSTFIFTIKGEQKYTLNGLLKSEKAPAPVGMLLLIIFRAQYHSENLEAD